MPLRSSAGRQHTADQPRRCASDGGLAPAGVQTLQSPDVAIRYFREALLGGTHWWHALLGAMQRWEHPRENVHGEWFTYLIQDEALDWLLLAERLTVDVWDLLPAHEVQALLFDGIVPVYLEEEQVRDLLGTWKHRAYLNFFYGVTVEEALLVATEQEIRRESPLGSYHEGRGEDAYMRVYEVSQGALLAEYLDRPEADLSISISYAEWKQFVYWLFKRRMQHALPARVASDTKKGLMELKRHYAAAGRASYRLWVDRSPAEGQPV